jgi:hypothetical protein
MPLIKNKKQEIKKKATTGLEPSSYRGELLSTLLYATA